MKKFLSYILIFIISFGLFGLVPIKQVSADDTGLCAIGPVRYDACVGNGSMGGQAVITPPIPNPPGPAQLLMCNLPGVTKAHCDEQTASPNKTWTDSTTGQVYGTTTGGATTAANANGSPILGYCYLSNVQDSVCKSKGWQVSDDDQYCIVANITQNDCVDHYSSWFQAILNFADNVTKNGFLGVTTTWYPPGQTPGTMAQQPLNTYTLLAPLPCPSGSVGCSGQLTTLDVSGTNSLGTYLNLIIKIFIGICAVLALIMIVMGGIEYMTSDLISSKEAGKERIRDALLGLVLALAAWTLLYTINPNLLQTNINIPNAAADAQLEPEVGVNGKTLSLGGQTFTACDQSEMQTVNLFGLSVTVNKAVVPSLTSINKAWGAMPAATRYNVTSVGGYNCRAVTNKPGYWSDHAFGLAIDINPSTNPYGSTSKTDMPASFIGLFTSNGWGWGGNWSSVKDPMHFSKDSGEGGSGSF